MKHSLFLFLILIAFAGCQQATDKEKIGHLQVELREMSAEENQDSRKVKAEKLIDLYLKFAKENPESPETQLYLYQAAGMAEGYQHNLPKALELYKQVYETFPQTEVGANAMYRSAILYRDSLKDVTKSGALLERIRLEYPMSFQAQQLRDQDRLESAESKK